MTSTDEESYRTLEEAALRVRYRQSFVSGGPAPWAIGLAAVALLMFGLWYLGFSPSRLLLGLSSLGKFVVLMFPPDWGDSASLWRFTRALAETVAIALLGTMLAAVIALPLSFVAARNTTVSKILRFFARRSFDTLRGIDTLVWALIWVNVVGLGPFAGVLAIASSDIGSFGKLFSEAIEGSDRKPVEGILASGGSRLHAIRFGILPQVAPVLIGQYLYYFESNTRSATIIGIVGAGGIGLQLSEQIRTLEWQTVCFIIIMILVTVSVIDLISSRLRSAIIGKSAPPV
jgi:phosphonate transport system permease protein